MSRVAILTSGRELVDAGLIDAPVPDRGGDWAELYVVDADPWEASLAGQYWAAGVRGFLATGDTDRLDPFVGQRIGGLPLLTDPDLIEEFDQDFGQVDFLEYYER